ncbi:MAG: UPF0489 family protein [Myxococcota bacterium]
MLIRICAPLLLAAAAGASQSTPAPADNPVEIVVCDSHHDVLPHWLRVARQGGLPRQGVTVVHLDAHPDLGVPTQPVGPGWPEHDGALQSALDIATFQLAAVRVGLVDRIVWLRPGFARQLPDGERRFRLGSVASGELRVDDPSDYYVLDDGWAPRESLRQPVVVELRVLSLDVASASGPLAEGPTVLDIDLDAFATRNPAADQLRRRGLGEDQLDALRRIFAPESLHLAEDPETRIRELSSLLAAVETLSVEPWTRWPGPLFTLWWLGISPLELLELAHILEDLPPDGAGEELLEEGRRLVGLPEQRLVSAAEIDAQVALLHELLASGAVRPQLVTVARSVRDGFTPPSAWPAIEWAVLGAVATALDDVRVRFDDGLGPAPRPAGH